MSDIDKSLKSMIESQEALDRLAHAPFDSAIKQQMKTLQAFARPNQFPESVRWATQMANEPFQRLQNQLASIFTPQITAASEMQAQSLAMAKPLQEFTQKISAMYNHTAFNEAAIIQAQYDALIAPIQEIAKQWNNSALLAFREPFLNDSLKQQLNCIQKSLTSFSSAFESIAIHANYVDMPETLIPRDYNYTEVDSSITYKSEKSLPGSINVKRLSISEAINVICSLITLFITIMTFLQTQQSSIQQQKNHEELVRLEQREIALQETANSMQKTENELLQRQIDSTEKNTEYLIELLNQLQEADANYPVALSPTGAALSDTDSSSQGVLSPIAPFDQLHPIEADDSEHFDTEPDSSEQR